MMNRILGGLGAVFVAAFLSGCSAMFVPATDDPGKKLQYAFEMLQVGRTAPAEDLIAESVDINRARGDDSGLADAYRAYGLFFRSKAVTKREAYYTKNGFRDRSVVWLKRYEASVRYLERSAALHQQVGRFDAAGEDYMEIAATYKLMEDLERACEAYDRGLEAVGRYSEAGGNTGGGRPGEVDAYEDRVGILKERLHCDG